MRISIRRRGFTLVELLVVIGIIGLLISILMPAITMAVRQSHSIKCMSNLRQVAQAFANYSERNNGCVVPAYNLPPLPPMTPASPGYTNLTAGPSQPMDGWPSVLDRDGDLTSGTNQDPSAVFYCPDTFEIDGVGAGQTGTNTGNMMGYTDWPMIFPTPGGDGGPKQGVTVPSLGLNKIVRCSYWMNAYNPVGGPPSGLIPANDLFYSNSVGYGPDANGNFCKAHRLTQIHNLAALIVAADGVYMGRQSVTQGESNCRIGYRHPGISAAVGAVNAAFADGHCERIDQASFPEASSASDTPAKAATKRLLNIGQYTIYMDPNGTFH